MLLVRAALFAGALPVPVVSGTHAHGLVHAD
jgi:hypothetical protein